MSDEAYALAALEAHVRVAIREDAEGGYYPSWSPLMTGYHWRALANLEAYRKGRFLTEIAALAATARVLGLKPTCVVLSKEDAIEAAKAAHGCASAYEDKAVEAHNAGLAEASKEWAKLAKDRHAFANRLCDLVKPLSSTTLQEGE